MVYHQSMNDSSTNPKTMLSYRIIACVTFAVLITLLAVVSRIVINGSNFGFTWHYATGTIKQVFLTHPDGGKMTIRDRVVMIDGTPVSLVTGEEMYGLVGSINLELVSPNGDIRQIEVQSLRNNFLMTLESMALPVLGILLFIPGFLLVFLKTPHVTEMHFLMFGFFSGMYLIAGQGMAANAVPIFILYYLGLFLASWSFLEFHWRYLIVKPPGWLQQTFRIVKILFALFLLYGSLFQYHVSSWQILLDLMLITDLLISFLLTFIAFISQLTKREFSVGTVRTLFLSNLVATSPLLIFYILPTANIKPALLPLIVVALPLLILPVNYFILMMNRKDWIKTAIMISSFTTAIFVEQLLVLFGKFVLPGGLPDYRVTSNWFDYLVSVTVLGVFLALYAGINGLFHRLIYGNVYNSSNELYRAGFSAVTQNLDERPIIEMTRLFVREFFRYDYINVCLIDGTVLQFDAENKMQVLQFDEARMRHLVDDLGREQTSRGSGNVIDRSVTIAELKLVKDQFPQVFGEYPRFCYLLFGAKERLGFIATGERRRDEPFDLIEMQQVMLLLRQFEVIAENLLLFEQIEQTNRQVRLSGQQMLQMRENERKRIARDMHDNIIQAITAFRYQLNELYDSDKLTISDEESDDLQHNLLNITQDIRDICFDLRPPALDATGLQSAVVSLVESYHQRGDLFINVQVVGEEIVNAVSDDVAICIYRVLQESLLNIRKHAGTKLASVNLIGEENRIMMVVGDEGHGFQVPERINELVVDGHFGLMGAQEFLDTVNGVFSVNSVPGKGATINAVIPLVREVGENGVFYDYRR